MTYTEKRLEEFEEMFPTLRQDLPNGIYMYSRMDFPEGDLRAIKPFINKLIHQALAEERERMRGEIKEFRHEYRNLNVSSEFDIAFDNFLSSLDINNLKK